jgi:large subunit ribosomal protein L17
MRHYKKGRKLGSDASHTKAIKKNLCVNLFTNDRIKTTLERAKEIRGDVDRVITWAKRGDVHARRLAIAKLGDKQLVGEIFSKVEQGLFKDRPGGYSRIYKVGKRRGDDAIIVLMELVQEPVKFKGKDSKETSKLEVKAAGKPAKAAKTEQAVADAEVETAQTDADVDVVTDVDVEPAEVDITSKEADAEPPVDTEAPEAADESTENDEQNQ